MGQDIQLRAGDIVVQYRTDSDDIEEAFAACHSELSFMISKWVEAEESCVNLETEPDLSDLLG